MKIKKICILFILILLTFSTLNIAYGKNENETITQLGNQWIEIGEKTDARFDTNIVSEGFEEIAGLLLGIGIFVAVAVGIILGIRFMFSSAEAKAEVSKLLTPFIVGTVLIVGALAIWKIAIQILDI